MTESANQTDSSNRGVLQRDAVRVIEHPALVECSGHDAEGAASPITVVPLVDGHRVAGFEVRCGCGSSAIVECVYTTEASNE